MGGIVMLVRCVGLGLMRTLAPSDEGAKVRIKYVPNMRLSPIPKAQNGG